MGIYVTDYQLQMVSLLGHGLIAFCDNAESNKLECLGYVKKGIWVLCDWNVLFPCNKSLCRSKKLRETNVDTMKFIKTLWHMCYTTFKNHW
jgi:hypothetical protein